MPISTKISSMGLVTAILTVLHSTSARSYSAFVCFTSFAVKLVAGRQRRGTGVISFLLLVRSFLLQMIPRLTARDKGYFLSRSLSSSLSASISSISVCWFCRISFIERKKHINTAMVTAISMSPTIQSDKVSSITLILSFFFILLQVKGGVKYEKSI